ncbi:Rossmann-like fold-containing protein, partial [Streptomyces atratus]
LLLGILAKAASAIMKIIKDPIGFLGNLVKAVGAGLQLFVTNIATHLKTGVVSWLLGTAVKAGLELPQKFDLKGIIQLIASLLGLTWDNIRARITRKGIPDQAMTAVESSVPVAKKLATEGPAGAVKEIETEAGDLKATILEKLTSYLIPTVIIAGITWIISLLNPASAFVRAVKGIIDIVTFIVNQGAQIVEFVNAVLDAVIAIANGGSAGVPKMVEAALAASVPLLIGFLASLLGIGSLANKVKSAFHAVSKPVNRAIDKIVDFIVKRAKNLLKKSPQNISTKEENPKNGSRADIQQRWRRGMAAIRALASQPSKDLDPRKLHSALSSIKGRYGFQKVTAHRHDDTQWRIYAKLNPDNSDNLIPMTGQTLILGEGNFTFTESAVNLNLNVPGNIRATEYKDRESVTENSTIAARVERLEQAGVTVEFGVDGRTLEEKYRNATFSTIIWMFPHPGGDRPTAATRGREMLSTFFRSAKQRLAPGGKIIITLRASEWYIQRWRPVQSAQLAGLNQVDSDGESTSEPMDFNRSSYPGYTHETTESGAARPDAERGWTFIFS